MPVDLEYLRRHYASLSDEALLALDRSELVETAQKCYDGEVVRRKPIGGTKSLVQTADLESHVPGFENKPEWQLSDEELRGMDPKVAFCGLFDRVERVTRAFDEEIARRQSKSKSPWFS
jgi:hypothetical protein